MDWLQFSFNSRKDEVDELSDKLSELGAVAISLEEDKKQPIYQSGTENLALWDNVKIVALFNHDFNKDLLPTEIQQLGTWQTIAEQDWLHKWKEDLKPMLFANKLWICPSWCEVPDANAKIITLDPEMAFGTGSHPTTALCLEWIVNNVLPGQTVIDYGCGSGILGIAAAKFGAEKVYAVDIDPTALEVSLSNARKNNVNLEQFNTYLPEQMPNIQADIVVANILANPLIELSEVICNLVKANGTLVLSGILLEQSQAIKEVYGHRFSHFEITPQDEWVRIVASCSMIQSI